ncbi:hypothetical protein ACLOJK_018760 [Asimina triloba]
MDGCVFDGNTAARSLCNGDDVCNADSELPANLCAVCNDVGLLVAVTIHLKRTKLLVMKGKRCYLDFKSGPGGFAVVDRQSLGCQIGPEKMKGGAARSVMPRCYDNRLLSLACWLDLTSFESSSLRLKNRLLDPL